MDLNSDWPRGTEQYLHHIHNFNVPQDIREGGINQFLSPSVTFPSRQTRFGPNICGVIGPRINDHLYKPDLVFFNEVFSPGASSAGLAMVNLRSMKKGDPT